MYGTWMHAGIVAMRPAWPHRFRLIACELLWRGGRPGGRCRTPGMRRRTQATQQQSGAAEAQLLTAALKFAWQSTVAMLAKTTKKRMEYATKSKVWTFAQRIRLLQMSRLEQAAVTTIRWSGLPLVRRLEQFWRGPRPPFNSKSSVGFQRKYSDMCVWGWIHMHIYLQATASAADL